MKTRRIQFFLENTRDNLRLGTDKMFVQKRGSHGHELDFLGWLIEAIAIALVLQALLRIIVSPAASNTLLPLLISTPFVVLSYVAYRANNYRWTIAAVVATCYVAFLTETAFGGTFGGFDALAYLIIPLMIGVLILTPRMFFILVLIDAICVCLAVVLAAPIGSTTSLPATLFGICFMSVLAIVTNRYFRAVEQDRLDEVGKNESVFNGLITNLPVIIVVLDADGIITLVEGRALETIGFDPTHFIGRSVFEAYDDAPKILEDARRALTGEVFGSTTEIQGFSLEVWYSPLLAPDGKIRGVVAVATDVTERQRAEDIVQQQASLLQSVSDAIISVDLDFNIETWNRAAEEMYGWLDYEVMGKPIREAVVTEEPNGWEQDALAQVMEKGAWECELLQRQKDGTVICVLASFALLEDAERQATGLIIVGRDITQRKRAEEQMLELSLEREKVKLLREFIGDSSHDFRTPLATIRTSAYLLRKKHPDISTRHLDVIETEVDHIGRLVEDLLTLARLDGAPTFEFEPLEINGLIERVLIPLQLLATTKKQTLSFQHNDDLLTVRGDAVELERVLVNILTNAINYTPAEGSINVMTICGEKMAIIRVSDTGVGISSEDLPRIFDRFFRVDKTRGSKTGGAGLGLAIAQKIIEAHGGKISAESTLSVGTTFVIELPLI